MKKRGRELDGRVHNAFPPAHAQVGTGAWTSLVMEADMNVAEQIENRAGDLSTQEAADLLNVNRPHLVSLVDAGEIPFQKSGSHRRVSFSDLQKYREPRDQKRRKVLDDMTREAHEQGLNGH